MQRPSWQPPPSSTGNTMSTGALAKVRCFADLKFLQGKILDWKLCKVSSLASVEGFFALFVVFGLLLQDPP